MVIVGCMKSFSQSGRTMQTIRHQHQNRKRFCGIYNAFFRHWSRYHQHDCPSARGQTKNGLEKDKCRLKIKINFVRDFEIISRPVILRLQIGHFWKIIFAAFLWRINSIRTGRSFKNGQNVENRFFWWSEFLLKWNNVRFLKRIKFIAKIYTDVSNNWNMKKYFLINEQTIINVSVFKAFFIKSHQRLQNKHINTKKWSLSNVRFAHGFFHFMNITSLYMAIITQWSENCIKSQ